MKLLVAVLEYFVIRPFCYSDVTCLTCLSFALPHDGGGRHLLCRVDAGVSECSMCHVPYNEAVLPFPIHLSRCAICGLVLLVFFTVASQQSLSVYCVKAHVFTSFFSFTFFVVINFCFSSEGHILIIYSAVHCCCCVVRIYRVPDILFTTIEPPPDLPIVGKGCFIQARICRPKKESRGEANAKEISDVRQRLFLH